MLSVNAVSFATDGWVLLEASEFERTWQNERGDELTIMFWPDSENPDVDREDIDDLRAIWREMMHREGGALVEAVWVKLDGASALRTIAKFPQEPHGMRYSGGFTIPLPQGHFGIKVGCRELGTTGVRDAVVWMSLPSSEIDEDDPLRGCMQDPYDPADDEQYDSKFPDHPLSRVRAALLRIEATASVEPAVRSLQTRR